QWPRKEFAKQNSARFRTRNYGALDKKKNGDTKISFGGLVYPARAAIQQVLEPFAAGCQRRYTIATP
ncbi:hypothetical protein BGX31_006720, partial [Mortierella sp. GBA43]